MEDILDSGMTLDYIKGMLQDRNPASIRICTLLDKPARRKADLQADYVGFTVPRSSSSVTALTMTRDTATCLTSVCSSRRSIRSERDESSGVRLAESHGRRGKDF